jgi:Ca2+-binding EF-hand superfamily protein
MGAEGSKFGVSAIAQVCNFDMSHIQDLQAAFKASIEPIGETILVCRGELDKCMKLVTSLQPSDAEILDRVFILLDKDGVDEVEARSVLIALATLIKGTAADKLKQIFQLFDINQTGLINGPDMRDALLTANDIVSYFGDPVLTRDQVIELVRGVFDTHSVEGGVPYSECMNEILQAPLMVTFFNGEGTVRYVKPT